MKLGLLGTGAMGLPMARRRCPADSLDHGPAELDHSGLSAELAGRNGMR
jgi:hypothetical protein